MSPNSTIDNINNQLEKAREIRYFVLLATFVFFLDFILVVFKESNILALSYKDIAEDYSLGQVLLFFVLFTFFMSFVVPLTQYILLSVRNFLPYKLLLFFFNDQWKNIDPKDYFNLDQLKHYAIKNSDAIAYEYYKSLASEKDKEHQLNFFCLALIISVILNSYAYFEDNNAILSLFVPFFSNNPFSFPRCIGTLFLMAIIFFIVYLGIIRAGGFALTVSDRIYFSNNNFKNFE